MNTKPVIPITLDQFKIQIEHFTPLELDKATISYNHCYLGSWGKQRLEAIKHCRAKFRETKGSAK
jgi:hypothetical protein